MDKFIALRDTDSRELEQLFKNIQQGLKKYSLQELNESISTLVNGERQPIPDKQKHINAVIDIVCIEFKLDKSSLLVGRGKGKIQEARKYAYCILYNDINLPLRFIAKNVFCLNWHTSVAVAIQYYKSLKTELKPDREFLEKLNHLRIQIQNKLNKE